MNQQNTMAATAAANLVQGIATKLYGEAGSGVTDLIALNNLVNRQSARLAPSNPLLAVARRNIRKFLAMASFSSSVDRWSAGQCVDVMEAAIDAPPAQAAGPCHANGPGRTLYIDLDGVMADFDGAFPQVFGLDHRSLADDEMWGHINGHPSFFRDLPPMRGAVDFFRCVEHLNPVILTACPKSNYPHVAAQKRAWVRAHLSQTCMVLPVLGGRHKPLFMHQAGDVLIDDFGKNCIAWEEAGGVAIKHEGDWAATRAALLQSGVSS